MLDNLQETFAENSLYLASPDAAHTSAYTWQILEMDKIRPRLDKAIEKLNTNQLVNQFVLSMLSNSSVWMKNDEDKITLHICKYMLELFSSETNRSLQDYLFDKYPRTQGNLAALVDEIEKDILRRVHNSAIPMFWCDPTYHISDPTYTFESSSLSVPNTCTAICTAAANFSQHHSNYAIRQTGIGDRIFALRFVSGIPLFAYQGITKLKGDYDAAQGTASGAGSHLYSETGRGSSHVDWRSYIPTPMPYSRNRSLNMNPEGERWSKIYQEAVDKGVIGMVGDAGNQRYVIFRTPELDVKDYTIQDFMDGDVFSKVIYDAELYRIQHLLQSLHNVEENPDCTTMNLKNDGDKDLCKDKKAVRIDYFIKYPVMHKIVLDEIDKHDRLMTAVAQLKAIHAECFAYEDDLKKFSTLLFRGVLSCRNISNEINYDKTASVSCDYKDRYGDPATFYLTKNTPNIALYKAFMAYRGKIGGNSQVWESMEDELKHLETANTTLQDTYVAAALEQVWDNRAMDRLRDETLKGASLEAQKDVLRFYNGLRSIIRELKNNMSQWPNGLTVAQLTAAIAGKDAAPTQMPDQVYVWHNGQNLVVYSKQYPNWAINPATNSWVPLNPTMSVWNPSKNAWEPIHLDAQGNILIV